MSLKAKIEAVIYASEEPVTLAQLTGLLGNEAQAELDRLHSAQGSLSLEVEDNLAEPTSLQEINEAGDPLLANPDTGQQPSPDGFSKDEAVPPETAETELISEKDEKKAARDERARTSRLREHFRSLLNELIDDYAEGDRGLEIREVAGGYRLATKPEYHDAVRGFVRSLKPPLKLSLQALETLAVVAYKQPVTAPEISEIRGVDSGGVLGSLMTRKLITTAGRKQVIGRPILYKTTKDFLLRFGLRDVTELPSIEEFEKMANDLVESDPTAEVSQEETTMKERQHEPEDRLTTADLEEELAATEPQADGDSTALNKVPVDGRISGVPPQYDATKGGAEEESPALDAAIQSDGRKESR